MDPSIIADEFWHGTGYTRTFPRPIEQALALKFPVTLVKLSDVTVQSVGAWLRQKRHCRVLPRYDRDLMGCLFAHKGQGFIFVCGTDPPDEQRFTVSHDAAHFIVDYWLPRQHVLQALGASIIPVLDGDRRPTVEERAAAVLARVHLGPHWHLLPRRGRQIEDDPHIAHIENRADLLGLELVAPKRFILEKVKSETESLGTDVEAHCRVLAAYFGVPAYVFETIVRPTVWPKTPTFLEEALRILGR